MTSSTTFELKPGDDLHATYILADAATYLGWDGLEVAQTARRWLVLRMEGSFEEMQRTIEKIKEKKKNEN